MYIKETKGKKSKGFTPISKGQNVRLNTTINKKTG
jgi:hypothetical protein